MACADCGGYKPYRKSCPACGGNRNKRRGGTGNPVTYDECRQVALRHTTRAALRRSSPRVYRAIRYHGWPELLTHMNQSKHLRFRPGSAEEQFVVDNYDQLSLTELSDALGYGINVTNREVNRVLTHHGLKPRLPGVRTGRTQDRARFDDVLVIRLRHLGLTAREIGRRIGLTRDGVRYRFKRIKRLRSAPKEPRRC